MEWYYRVDEVKHGPVSRETLGELAALGQVDGDTQVWSPDLPNWQRAGDVPQLDFGTRPVERFTVSSAEGSTPTPDVGKTRPWARYFARMIDISILGFIWGGVALLILTLTAPALADAFFETEGLLFYVVTIAALIPLEAVLLSSFGTTPGKWLLGLRVGPAAGGKPSFEAAIQRTALVWWRGLALGVPIVALFTMVHAMNVLQTAGVTTWDRDTHQVVQHRPLAGLQFAAWFVLAALVALALV